MCFWLAQQQRKMKVRQSNGTLGPTCQNTWHVALASTLGQLCGTDCYAAPTAPRHPAPTQHGTHTFSNARMGP